MFGPYLPHRFRDLAPSQPMDPDQSKDLDIFLGGPFSFLDDWIEMVEPLLPTVIDIPEVLCIGFEEQLKGDTPPIDIPLLQVLLHNLREQLDLLRFPMLRNDAIFLTNQHLDLVLDEAQTLRLENILYFLSDIDSLYRSTQYQML